MSKLSACVHTINLAKISQPHACPPGRLPLVQIRVCNPRLLKDTCPPDPCKCPPKLTLAQTLKLAGILALQLAVIAGVDKWIQDAGVCDDSHTTAQLMREICAAIVPFLWQRKTNKEIIFTEKLEKGWYKLKCLWNDAVTRLIFLVFQGPRQLMMLARGAEQPAEKTPLRTRRSSDKFSKTLA